MEKNAIATEYLTRIEQRMVRKKLNRKQLAEVVGVTPHTMGRILNQEVDLRVLLLLKVCDVLELHAPTLLNDSMGAVMAERLAKIGREVPADA